MTPESCSRTASGALDDLQCVHVGPERVRATEWAGLRAAGGQQVREHAHVPPPALRRARFSGEAQFLADDAAGPAHILERAVPGARAGHATDADDAREFLVDEPTQRLRGDGAARTGRVHRRARKPLAAEEWGRGAEKMTGWCGSGHERW